ncbi:MAG: hypothetical protein JWM11_589 [Planctomycetaceae bacterium]|nr:hypothetical protein [Planctomycetaceae bacterium]
MADPLKVECPHCGGALKLKDRSADGKKVRCPKCQEPFKVELPVEDEELDDLDNLDDLDDMEASDDGYEDEDAPRKKSKGDKSKGGSPKKSKKKKSKSGSAMLPLMIGGIALGGVAVVGLIVFAAMSFSGARNKINLAYLLPEHDGIARIKFADMLKAPLLADFVNSPEFKQMGGGGVGSDLQPSDFDTITMGFKTKPGGGAEPAMGPGMGPGMAPGMGAGGGGIMGGVVVVIRTKKPFDLKKDEERGTVVAATHNGKKYYKGKMPLMPSMFGADSYTLVTADEADLKRVLDQGSSSKRRPEFDFIDPEHQILIAAVPTSPDAFKMPEGLMKASAGPTGSGGGAAQQLQKSFSETAQGVSLVIDIGEGIEIAGKLNCKDEGGAGGLKGQLDLVMGEAKTQFEAAVKSNPLGGVPEVKEMVDLARQTLSSIAFGQNKNVVDLKLSVPPTLKSIATKLKNNPLFATMMQGAMAGAMGGSGGMGGMGAGGMPGQPRFGAPNSMGNGQPNFGANPGNMPGAFPGGTPMPGAFPGGGPMPNGAFPGGAPMPNGAFPGGVPMPGVSPMPMPGVSPMPMPGVSPMPMPGGLTPMPNAAFPGGVPMPGVNPMPGGIPMPVAPPKTQ